MSISGGLGQQATLAMWAPDGRLIARTKLSLEQVERPFVSTVLAERAARQKSGTLRTISAVDGIDRIIAYRAIEDWPVIVTASVPVDSALADWWRGLWWSAGAILVLLAALAGFTLVALRLSRREEAALADLTAANAALDARQQELSAANETLRTALADKELLLREIHHRVKNNLQVTASLLRMQSRRFSDPAVRDAFAQTDERLRAIALLHETLYRSDLSGQVAVASYLRRIVDEMSSAHWIPEQGVVISVDADPVSVSLDRALPLGLVLTEVLSNAIRHAFEPGCSGRIEVTARMLGSDLEVSVRDDGRGLPAEPVSGTLGMRLIHSFVMQLGGSFTLETDGGTVFRLLVPTRDGETVPPPVEPTPEVGMAAT
jgi:two-component sensor histidine kinase